MNHFLLNFSLFFSVNKRLTKLFVILGISFSVALLCGCNGNDQRVPNSQMDEEETPQVDDNSLQEDSDEVATDTDDPSIPLPPPVVEGSPPLRDGETDVVQLHEDQDKEVEAETNGVSVVAAIEEAVDETDNDVVDTSLHEFVKAGDKESVLEYLQKYKKVININATDEFGLAPIHHACMKGYTDLVEILVLQGGASVHVRDDNVENTCLHYASVGCYVDVIDKLLELKSDIDARNKYDKTPLHVASFNGCTDEAELLIQQGADFKAKDSRGHLPLHDAAEGGQTKTAEKIIKLRGYVNTINVRDGFFRTPLHYACMGGHTETVEMFLDRFTTYLEILWKRAAQEMIDRHNTLFINAQDKLGNTCLHYVSEKGHSNTADLLIKRGSNFRLKNYENDTPLHLAHKARHGKIKPIIEAEIDRIQRNQPKRSPKLGI